MQQPTIGRVVHYQSHGSKDGTYLPEPRAAIITEAKLVGDVKAILRNGWALSGCHADGVHAAFTRDTMTPIPREDTPTKFKVSVAVLNPTGLFFGQDLDLVDEPTPGCVNWPPRV